jgi:hypothetical protein
MKIQSPLDFVVVFTYVFRDADFRSSFPYTKNDSHFHSNLENQPKIFNFRR